MVEKGKGGKETWLQEEDKVKIMDEAGKNTQEGFYQSNLSFTSTQYLASDETVLRGIK